MMFIAFLTSAVSGRWLIPIFRFFKTGMFEARIGSRMVSDGTSPRFGGAVALTGLLAGAAVYSAFPIVGGTYSLGWAVLAYILLVFLIGFLQDYIKQKLRRPAGIKLTHEVLYVWGVSFCFLLLLEANGAVTTSVLLPFRWGFLEMGLFYCPVISFVMTFVICTFCVHDSFGGEEEYSAGGLTTVSTLLISLFFAVMGEGASMLGYILAGAAAGLLIWELSPPKIYLGQSGQMLFGAGFCAMAIISLREMLLIILPVSAIMEFTAAFIRYFYYVKTKKVLLSGGSIHSHLKKKGYGDMFIILLFIPLDAVGIITGIMFMLYSFKLM